MVTSSIPAYGHLFFFVFFYFYFFVSRICDNGLKQNIEVVRLPVAHSTLNPIELAWAPVKCHIKANSCEFNLTEVECVAHEEFEVVTFEHWASLVKHV